MTESTALPTIYCMRCDTLWLWDPPAENALEYILERDAEHKKICPLGSQTEE